MSAQAELAQTPTPPASADLRELLHAYRETLDTIDTLPAVVWVPHGALRGRVRVPRMRWFARYFAINHVSRTLACLRRRHYADRAVGDPHAPAAELDAIEDFERSLPPIPSRLLVLVFVFAVFLAALLVGGTLGRGLEAEPLEATTQAILGLDAAEVLTALRSFDTVREILVGALALSISLHLVVLVPMSAFRLTLMLFNLYPAAGARLRQACASDHLFGSDGVYRLEAAVFERRRARRPPELRFDLLVDGALIALGLCLGVFFAISLLGQAAAAAPRGGGSPPLALLGDAREAMLANLTMTVPAILLLTLSLVRVPTVHRRARRRVLATRPAAAVPAAPLEQPLEPGVHAVARWPRRTLAYLVDAAIFSVLWFLVISLWAVTLYDEAADESGAYAMLILLVIGPAGAVPLLALPALRRGRRNGQTLGKQALGLRVVRRDGRRIGLRHLLARELLVKAYLFGVLSLVLLGLPLLADYLWSFRDERRRTLHDRIAGTLVVRA